MNPQSKDSYLVQLDQTLKEWTKDSVGRRHFLMGLPVLLAACSSGQKTRYREGDNSGQQTALSVADEKKMTAEYLPQMQKDYPPVKDPYLQSYISDLGQKIVSANKLHQNPYTYSFTLVEAKMINAFALPAGTIMVTAPLMAMADSEAELAGVVGHEVGHVAARHSAERLDEAKKQQSKSWLYALGGGLVGGAAGFGLGKLMCRPQDSKCLQQALAIGAMAGAGGGLLVQKYGFMANSREDEMEADRVGFRTSVAAGFDKDHVGLFYEKLLDMQKKAQNGSNALTRSLADAMSTHPPGEDRVEQMRSLANSGPQGKGVVSSSAFLNAKKRLKT